MEVKNKYAYVFTQDICSKFIEVFFCVCDVWFLGQIVYFKIEHPSIIKANTNVIGTERVFQHKLTAPRLEQRNKGARYPRKEVYIILINLFIFWCYFNKINIDMKNKSDPKSWNKVVKDRCTAWHMPKFMFYPLFRNGP